MSDFPYIPATKRSLSCRHPVYGVGVNDAPYITTIHPKGEAKQVCPFYRKWFHILERTRSLKYQQLHPTYNGTSVDEKWLSFMTFREWMEGQEWKGLHLDKDILVPGNKRYGPEFCVFVTGRVNTLLTDCRASRGKLPIGVYLNKPTGRFMAYCQTGKRMDYLGLFDTPEQAHVAYCERKSEVIIEVALEQPDLRVRDALLLRAAALVNIIMRNE